MAELVALLYSERPKFYKILTFLNAIGLKKIICFPRSKLFAIRADLFLEGPFVQGSKQGDRVVSLRENGGKQRGVT